MADELPAPLVPPDVDLRDFQFMPLDVRRLLTSETWLLGSAEEKVAAVALWCEAWHQIPASSVPDNEKMLAHLSQAGARWKKVRDHVMRSWIKCSDGRLYHPVVAEKALESWGKKEAQRERSKRANEARWGKKEEANDLGNPERRRDRGGMEEGQGAAEDERRDHERPPQAIHQGVPQGSAKDIPDVIPQAYRKESRNDPKGQGQGQGQGNRMEEEADARARQPDKPLGLDPALRSARNACMGVITRHFPDLDRDIRAYPGLTGSLGTVDSWIGDGADLDRDILPVIEATCIRLKGRNDKPRSFGLFTQGVAVAKSRNSAPLPESNHGQRASPDPGKPLSAGQRTLVELAAIMGADPGGPVPVGEPEPGVVVDADFATVAR